MRLCFQHFGILVVVFPVSIAKFLAASEYTFETLYRKQGSLLKGVEYLFWVWMDVSKSGEQQLSSLILLISNNERFIGLQFLGYIFNWSKHVHILLMNKWGFRLSQLRKQSMSKCKKKSFLLASEVDVEEFIF